MKTILIGILCFILMGCSIRIYKVEIAGDCKEFKVEVLAEVPKQTTVSTDANVKIPLMP